MTTIDFIMFGLFLIEMALSSYVLHYASFKGPDDILFIIFWPLFEVIKLGGFLMVSKSNMVYIVVALFYMIDFVIISVIHEHTTNIKYNHHKIKL